MRKLGFPKETTIRFDYAFKERSQDEILGWFNNPEVVGVLSDKEYENLLYAMIKSDDVPKKYQILFDNILTELMRS